jgi:hypothetical protein
VRQYPLQALRRPYRRLPCRWRRDAAPGRTRHCPSLHLASQREDAPAPMDRTARLRQETPRGSSPGESSRAAAKRRPRIRPRTPTKKSEHPGAQIGPWPDSDGENGRWLPKATESGRKGNSRALPAGAQNGHQRAKWQPLQGEGAFNLCCLEWPDRTCTCTRLFWLFCTLFAVGSHRVGDYISKQYTITRTVFLTMKKPVLHETSVGKYPAKRRYT